MLRQIPPSTHGDSAPHATIVQQLPAIAQHLQNIAYITTLSLYHVLHPWPAEKLYMCRLGNGITACCNTCSCSAVHPSCLSARTTPGSPHMANRTHVGSNPNPGLRTPLPSGVHQPLAVQKICAIHKWGCCCSVPTAIAWAVAGRSSTAWSPAVSQYSLSNCLVTFPPTRTQQPEPAPRRTRRAAPMPPKTSGDPFPTMNLGALHTLFRTVPAQQVAQLLHPRRLPSTGSAAAPHSLYSQQACASR